MMRTRDSKYLKEVKKNLQDYQQKYHMKYLTKFHMPMVLFLG